MNTTLLKFGRALLFALLSASAGSALATPNFGTRLDDWCAMQPIQSTPPQQSRPYRASGFACTMCHNTNTPSVNDLNARGNASASCTGTTCGTAVNNFCVATPPTASAIAIASPPAGTVVTQGQSVTFTAGGTSTSPDGFLLSYTWLFSNGLPSADGFSVTVPMNTVGPVTATLQVRNQVGMLATGTPPTRSVTVTAAGNMAPTASVTAPAGNVTVAQGGTVTFMGSGNDPDNNLPLTYNWNFGGGAANSTAQNPGAVTFNTAGTFTVSFTVTDSLGLSSAPVTRTVTVTPVAGNAPIAVINEPSRNRTIARGASIEFHAAADNTEEDDDDLIFNWTFPGGTPASSTRKEVRVFFNTAGIFTVTLTATDSQGHVSAPASRVITVTGPANMAPSATITAPAGDVSVAQGGTVTFMGSGSDPDSNLPLTYNWNFGGGAPDSTAQNPGAVRFDTAGTFIVTFTVTDSLGLSSEPVTRTITVTPQMPVAMIVEPAMNVSILPGGKVTFKGSASGVVNPRFRWTFEGGNPDSSTRQNPGEVRFERVGTHTVTLRVTGSNGEVLAPVTRVVTVARPNASPRVEDDCLDGRTRPNGRDRDRHD